MSVTATPVASKKTSLPTGTTKANLLSRLAPIAITVAGRPFSAEGREFSTGSVGYNVNDKVEITLADGTKVKAQLGINITIIGSKEIPAGE